MARRALLALLLIICAAAPAHASQSAYDAFIAAKDEWGLSLGYGETIPDMGATRSRVQAVDITGRYGYFLSG